MSFKEESGFIGDYNQANDGVLVYNLTKPQTQKRKAAFPRPPMKQNVL